MNIQRRNTDNVVTSFEAPKKDCFVKSFRKENKLHAAYSLIDIKGERVLIDLRLYYPSETCYCCVWLKTPDNWVSASDRATGYGYHKESAAAGEALRKCGFQFKEGIDGRGDEAIVSALYAIGVYLGYSIDNLIVIKAYG